MRSKGIQFKLAAQISLALSVASVFSVNGCSSNPAVTKKGYKLDAVLTVGVCSPIVSWTQGSGSWYWLGDIYSPRPGEPPHGYELPLTVEFLFCGLDGDTIHVKRREIMQGTFAMGFWERSSRDLMFDARDKKIIYEDMQVDVVAVESRSITFIIRSEPRYLRSASN
jgi:hypothetical protein